MTSRNGVIKEQGFSLVELMIAMLLGTFLIGGLVSVFISSASNYKVQQALTEVQHKGRYILRVLRQDVQEAGFNLPESEAIREFVGDANSCAPGRKIFETYWKRADNKLWRYCYYRTADNLLMRNTGEKDVTPVLTPLEIAEGVEDWELSYAVDINNPGDGVVDQILVSGAPKTYVPQGSLQDVLDLSIPATWYKVRAVRLEVLVSSDTANVTNQAQQIAAPFSTHVPTGQRLYQVFTATLALRNRVK